MSPSFIGGKKTVQVSVSQMGKETKTNQNQKRKRKQFVSSEPLCREDNLPSKILSGAL